MFYFIRSWGMKKQQHRDEYYPYENFYWEPWHRLEDEIPLEERGEPFSYRDDIQIVYSNGGISGLQAAQARDREIVCRVRAGSIRASMRLSFAARTRRR